MPKEYTKEEFWKLYEKLPQELKEVVFAEDTADNIYSICERNGIDDERISEIARYTGRVLLGILPPEEFQETLEKELKLEKDVAKKVAQEISNFIFYPVKSSLEELYKKEITPSTSPTVVPPTVKSSETVPLSEEKPVPPSAKDIYREPIE